MRPISGRRAIWLARASAVMHALEPPGFGLALAGGIFLTMRQVGELVLLDRRGGSGDLPRIGLLLLVGITLVAASLLFFHRKERLLRHRLIAAFTALGFFAYGYGGSLREPRSRAFFGLTTLAPRTPNLEGYAVHPGVKYEINEWGLRGAEWAKNNAGGALRVAVVGESFVFGSGVDEEGTLPRQLDGALRERFARARFEVLNLGMPGNHLRSHLAMLRIAETELGAGAGVLCLTLPDDLSAWDGHEERVARQRITSFSFTSYLLGHSAATTLWKDREVARELSPGAIAFLQSEVERFAATRSGGTGMPLVVFAYSFEDPRVSELLRRIPNAVLIPPVRPADGYFSAEDGQPTALGNQRFASLIAGAFDPAWLARR